MMQPQPSTLRKIRRLRQFGFNVEPLSGQATMEAWRAVIGDQAIVDEYGRVHTLAEFEAFVERKKFDRAIRSQT